MRITFTVLLFGCWFSLLGQQLPQLTTTGNFLKDYNPSMLAESYFLFENTFSIDVNYRAQWLELEGHPVTQSIIAQNLFETKKGFSLLVGGRLVNDKTGPTGMVGGYANIGGLLSEDPYYGAWGAGISIGAAQYRVNTTEFKPRHGNDILTLDNRKQTYPDVGFGVSWYKRMRETFLEDGYVWAGLSVPQVIGSQLSFETGTNGEFQVDKLAHVILSGGFQKYFTKVNLVQPTFVVRYVSGAPVNVDLNVNYYSRELFWAGIGASSNRSLLLEAGVILGENIGFKDIVRIGYQFGYTMKDYGATIGNVHEFQLSYSFE